MQTVESAPFFPPSVFNEPDTTASTASPTPSPVAKEKANAEKKQKEQPLKPQSKKYNFFLYETVPGDTTQVPEEWIPLSMDSVINSYVPPEAAWHESLFTESAMQPLDSTPNQQVDTYTASWIFVLFAVTITTISLYANNHRFLYGDIILSAFSVRSMTRILRDCNINRDSSLLPMTLAYAMGLSLVGLYQIAENSIWMPFTQLPLNFAALFLCVSLYLWVKNRLIFLLGNVFDCKTSVMLYNQNTHVYNFIAGLLLAPMALVMFFNESLASFFFYLTIGTLILLFLLRLGRGLQLTLNNARHSKLYLVYYILVFEIIPLLILGKLLLLF